MPRPTRKDVAEMIVYGFFCVSLMVAPMPLRALVGLFVEADLAAKIVAAAISLLVALYIVSSAKVLWSSRSR